MYCVLRDAVTINLRFICDSIKYDDGKFNRKANKMINRFPQRQKDKMFAITEQNNKNE